MSIDLDWSLLDQPLTQSVETYLTSYLNTNLNTHDPITCQSVTLTDLNWGTNPPELTVLDVLDPYTDFNYPIEHLDFQTHVHVKYTGDLTFHLSLTLCIGENELVQLPIDMQVNQLHFDTVVLVAFFYSQHVLLFSLLECMQSDSASSHPRIIQQLHILTSVGDKSKHVLHNVSKIETFLVSAIHKLFESELIWPNYYSVSVLT